jgi:hypothetical protein
MMLNTLQILYKLQYSSKISNPVPLISNKVEIRISKSLAQTWINKTVYSKLMTAFNISYHAAYFQSRQGRPKQYRKTKIQKSQTENSEKGIMVLADLLKFEAFENSNL